jgi:hypothetical protein
MTPDKAIRWESYEVPSAAGRLYLPVEQVLGNDDIESIAALAMHYATAPERALDGFGMPVADGGLSKLRRFQSSRDTSSTASLILKRSPLNTYAYGAEDAPTISHDLMVGGLPDLKVNTALQAGLAGLDRPIKRYGTTYDFRAPKVHAAFILDRIEDLSVQHPGNTWIMDAAPGVHPVKMSDVPPRWRRHRLYTAALRLHGLTRSSVHFDDEQKNSNLLVAGTGPDRKLVTVIDMFAKEQLDY